MQPENQSSVQTTKHFKSFWPVVIIGVLSAIVGGLVVWSVNNTNLQEDINSLLPGSGYSKMHNQKFETKSGELKVKTPTSSKNSTEIAK
jgi:hypothetical protein